MTATRPGPGSSCAGNARTPAPNCRLFDTIEGMRHQVFATDTPPGDPTGGPIQFLEARHRAHARVEDRIRTGKDTGFGRFPSRIFAINQAWLQLALTGIDLLAWTQILLLDGDLAAAEPKKLRYRLLHVAARITRTRPTNPTAHRRNLALGNRTRHRVHPPQRAATPDRLTPPPHRVDTTRRNPANAPGPRHAPPPASPGTEINKPLQHHDRLLTKERG